MNCCRSTSSPFPKFAARVEVEPPLYTGEAIYQGPVPAQGIKGLPGTKVRLMVESNRPLSGGVLKFSGPVAVTSMVLSTSAGKDSEVNGEFVIEDSGSVDISVQDDAGQASRGTYTIPIERLQDQSPLVRLLQPKQTSFATPTASIPIGVSAEDDYGIQRCELYRSLNNSRFLPTDLEIPPGQIRRLQTGTVLPLAEYDLQPGDEIRLFVRVEDNDPNGPNAPVGKGSESSIVSIRIISQQDFERAQVQQQGLKAMMNRYQQAERRLESLAAEMQKLKEKLDAADPDSALAEELKKELQQLAEKMQEEADAIEKLS